MIDLVINELAAPLSTALRFWNRVPPCDNQLASRRRLQPLAG